MTPDIWIPLTLIGLAVAMLLTPFLVWLWTSRQPRGDDHYRDEN